MYQEVKHTWGIIILLFSAQDKGTNTNTLTMGPDGPLGPDGPSFPGGPYVETTHNHTCVTTLQGPCSCNTSVSWLYIGFHLESVIWNYLVELLFWLTKMRTCSIMAGLLYKPWAGDHMQSVCKVSVGSICMLSVHWAGLEFELTRTPPGPTGPRGPRCPGGPWERNRHT